MTSSKRPNILWICTDSQRWDTLGCYGNKWVNTPNIDRLAEEGILFENAFCQNPLCTPSRGNFLTGRYPVTNKLRQNGQNIRPDEVLITKILRDNGYVCGLSGKLHLSACDNRIKYFGRDPENWNYPPELNFRGVEPRIDDGYEEFYWDHSPEHPSPSSSYSRWLMEKGQKYKTSEREDCRYVKKGIPTEYHQTAFCVEKAIDFIKSYKNSPYPWLFSVNMFDPHFSLDPPEEFLQRYMDILEDIPEPDYLEGELDDKPYYHKIYQQKSKMNYNEMTAYDRKLIKASYWAMVDHIDYQVGRLLDVLEETGQKDNTMVIFISDHGEMLGDHGLYIKGPFLYEGAVHVPMILSYPGVLKTGTRVNALVELGDLAPTILDCTNLSRHPGMQTKSLWPYLMRKKDFQIFRQDVYCEYYNSNPNDPPQFCTMIRDNKYKIIVFHQQELGELYDLEADPKEFNNLWNNPEYVDVKVKMLKKVCDRMAQTADPLPERVGIY